MRKHSIVALVMMVAALATASVAVAGQAPDGWTAPRTADGRPDLGGAWASDSATPLQRPEELGDRTTLTDEEVAAMAAHAVQYSSVGGDAVFGETPFRRALGRAGGTGRGAAGRQSAGPQAVDRQLQPVLDERPLVREPHLAHHRSPERAHAAEEAPRPTSGRRGNARRGRPCRRTGA